MSNDKPKCKFCEREAWTGNVVDPPMCLQHLDVMILALRVQARGQFVTTSEVRQVFRALPAEVREGLSINVTALPGLLRQIFEAGCFCKTRTSVVVGLNGKSCQRISGTD